MTVKKKFSHLGFSIVFYLVSSNLIGFVAVFIASLAYTFYNIFDIVVANAAAGVVMDSAQIMNLVAENTLSSNIINLITIITGYFIAVPLAILVLNSAGFRDYPLKGLEFSTPAEKANKRTLSPIEFGSFLLFMFPLGIIGSLIGNLLAYFVSLITGQTMNDILSSTLVDMSLPMVFLLSVVMAPIFEEIMFRYAVIGYCKRWGEWNAIVISAFIFGLIHTNIFQFFYAFALGIVFGYVYLYTGRLIYSIIMHCVFNFCGAFVPMLLDPELSSSNTASVIYTAVQYGVALIGLILLIIYITRGGLMKTSQNAPIQRKLSKDAVLNPGMISLIIVCVILTAVVAFLPQV